MITGIQSPPAAEALIEFPDNRLLIELCGEFDRNLTEIETRLGVQILRRGNLLAVYGEDAARAEATEVLQSLYTRLEQGRPVDQGDIDREFRMNTDTPGPDAQLEMFQGGKVEIKTRKKLVEPRTDAQKAYVRSLYQNELAFGIGPAGTGKTYLAVAPRGIQSWVMAIPLWLKEKIFMRKTIEKKLDGYEGDILFSEHHESHAASAFFPSPFERAAILTVDGVGEWATTSIARGDGDGAVEQGKGQIERVAH